MNKFTSDLQNNEAWVPLEILPKGHLIQNQKVLKSAEQHLCRAITVAAAH